MGGGGGPSAHLRYLVEGRCFVTLLGALIDFWLKLEARNFFVVNQPIVEEMSQSR